MTDNILASGHFWTPPASLRVNTMVVINPPETKLDKCTSVHSEANESLGIFTSIEAAF